MRRSVAVSIILCVFFSLVIMAICCGLAHQILYWQKTPEKIYDMAYDYMFAVLLGTGATIFYNMISNILRALGDSRTPLVFLVFSSLLNIVLDVVFIVPFKMGVAGAAWATVLSQLLSAILCTVIGVRKFLILRLKKEDFQNLGSVIKTHMSMGFPMGPYPQGNGSLPASDKHCKCSYVCDDHFRTPSGRAHVCNTAHSRDHLVF